MPDARDLSSVRGRRALIIDICRRRQRPGTGSNLAVLMEGGLRMEWPDLSDVLGPIRWAVIGAVATRHYMPERATRDLDIIVAAEDSPAAERRLLGAGWEQLGQLTMGGSTWRSPEGVPLDLIECREPWCSEAIAEAQTNRDKQELPVLPLPYLVLTKLLASRGRDVGDLTQMLGMADEGECESVRRAVRRHAPQDLEDVEALIELGKLETGGT